MSHLPEFAPAPASSLSNMLQIASHNVLFVGFVFTSVLVILYFKTRGDGMDPDEPPLAHPRVPVIGHVLGMMKHQFRYFNILQSIWCLDFADVFANDIYRQRTDPQAPAFTMKTFSDKVGGIFY
jgi:hypothetical protein